MNQLNRLKLLYPINRINRIQWNNIDARDINVCAFGSGPILVVVANRHTDG
jgi:hypothetical protein